MTTSVSIGDVLTAPPLTPPPNGLLNTARVIDHVDTHWEGGISIAPENFDPAVVIDPCSTTPDVYERNRLPARSFIPFPVEAYDSCGTTGWQRADYEGRARRALAARETEAVEAQLDTDSANLDNPHFQDSTNTTAISGVFGLNNALDAAVQVIADEHLGIGMIHARPSLVNKWNRGGALLWRQNKIYTIGGHLVIPGSGYSGKAPDGTVVSATSEWIYVTDVLEVHRGAIETFLPESNTALVNRSNNTIEVKTARMYAVIGNFPGIWGIHVNPST